MDDKQHPFSCVEEAEQAELYFRHFDETISVLTSLFPEDKDMVW